MGGRQWSAEEEQFFWTVIIPKSPKRLSNLPSTVQSWASLAEEIQTQFGSLYRTYNEQSICKYLDTTRPSVVFRLPNGFSRTFLSKRRAGELLAARG